MKLDGYLPYRLAVASAWVSRLVSKAYERQFNLNIPQWRMIAILGDEGPMSQLQLSNRATMDKIATHRAASALKGKGIISVTDAKDRRFKIIELTSYGRKVFEEVAPLALKIEQQVLRQARIPDVANLEHDLRSLETAARALFGEMNLIAADQSDDIGSTDG